MIIDKEKDPFYTLHDGTLCICKRSDITKAKLNFFIPKNLPAQQLTNIQLRSVSRVDVPEMPCLKHVSLQTCSYISFKGNFSLESLKLYDVFGTEQQFFTTDHLKYLKMVSVINCENLDISFEHCAELENIYLDGCDKVKYSLNRSCIKTLSVSHIKNDKLVNFLQNNTIIENVKVRWMYDDERNLLFNALDTCTNLKALCCISFGKLDLNTCNFFKRLKNICIFFNVPCFQSTPSFDEILLPYCLVKEDFQPKQPINARKVQVQYMHQNALKYFDNVRELRIAESRDIKDPDLPHLISSNNVVFQPVIQRNLKKLYNNRLIMTLLACLKPKDVFISIAKEIKSWE
jgi:hypothetical protein